MSSAQDADLTAKPRIRGAAIAASVRDGFQKANVRAIAAAAGVSVGRYRRPGGWPPG